MNTKLARIREAQIETTGTACWLLMDLFWMLEQPAAATVAGVFSLAAWLLVFRYLPRKLAEWAANGAVACWVVMNLFWMLADQYERPMLTRPALVAFALSFVLLVVALWEGGLRGPALQIFRRFRLKRADE